MTVELAESLLQGTGVAIAVRQRFGYDKGALLRLDNDSILNIFDDGRYYFQGENFAELESKFSETEFPWDPQSDNGETSRQIGSNMLPFLFPTKRFNL